MEWDTAAGYAVLEASGGVVTQPDGSPFVYGKGAKENGPLWHGSSPFRLAGGLAIRAAVMH
jgi:3'-phosphoadenosine 5'-phosphosulfate (PAPS) 3'-phosphatase